MFADVLMRRLAAGLGLHIRIIHIPVEVQLVHNAAKIASMLIVGLSRGFLPIGKSLSPGKTIRFESRFAEE